MSRRVEASVELAAAPERVFEFLSDLRNHWRLEERFVELGALDGAGEHGPTGGRIRIRGPLGLGRVARTRVLEADAPRRLAGRAEIGRTTVGLVGWEIEARAGGGSAVRLVADVASAAPGDRLLLALGGRRWLERLFVRALERLRGVVDG